MRPLFEIPKNSSPALYNFGRYILPSLPPITLFHYSTEKQAKKYCQDTGFADFKRNKISTDTISASGILLPLSRAGSVKQRQL